MTHLDIPPILFLVFNRPDVTKRVFDTIRLARPRQLFVAADGPRAGRIGEKEKCDEVREIVQNIDWDCDLKTLFRDTNHGCRVGVSTAIDWFFSYVEEGVIIEDDCLPDNSFFKYCGDLLEKYRNDKRIMSISGDNYQFGRIRNQYSYYFSRYNHCWGWATWKRAWEYYDRDMSLWPEIRKQNSFKHALEDNKSAKYWTKIFDRCFAGEIDSWAYRWTFSCWCQSGLTILPNVNLVSNIGFGEDATHTSIENHLACIETFPMTFPLRHPGYVIRDTLADTFTQKHSINPPILYKRILNKLQRIITRQN
jgi:hypothetical protein